jgi:TIR domain
MGHVFISYSRQDTPIIERLVRELEAAAVAVWIDREDILGGAKRRRQIVDAIEAANVVLVALSPNAPASDNVRKELDIAQEANKPVLPVEIRRTVVPKDMVYQLVGLQRIDLTTGFDVGVKRLVESVRALVTAPQALVRLSPEVRSQIKELMIDPALSASDRLSLASLILLKDSARIRDKALADLEQLDEKAQKRIDLRDKLRQGGSSLEMYALTRQQEEDGIKRKLILEQIEQARKVNELALSQMKAALTPGQS